MKPIYKILFLAITLILSTIPSQLFAQTADTLDISPLPVGNINTIINGDTIAGGGRAHPNRVYRLQRALIYQLTKPITIKGPLKIIATEGLYRPPVLAPAILQNGTSIGNFFNFVGKGASVEINDVYLLSVRSDNKPLDWSTGIEINSDSLSLKLRGVIFDSFSYAGIRLYAHWVKIDVQDCVFRNNQHPTSYFAGDAFMSDAPNHLDTCKFINNTFFSNNSYLWSVRGYDKYSVFEHNTVVYGIVNPFLIRQASNLHIRNNIFYSLHSFGGTPQYVHESWFLNYPDTISSSLIHIRTKDTQSSWYDAIGYPITGPEVYVDPAHGVFSDMLAPELRTYEIVNNVYAWPQALKDFYNTYNDSVTTRDSFTSYTDTPTNVLRKLIMPKFITEYSQYVLDSLLAGKANIDIRNNIEADPDFYPNIVNHTSEVISYVGKLVTGTIDKDWRYAPSGKMYPPVWPLPEVLTYANTALQNAGSDGYAVGDLNWFPEQKAKWLEEPVVPVELTTFTATSVKEGIKLNWATASETNNQGFEIQRSADGKNFIAISFVEGNGTSSEKSVYSYLDKNLTPGLYYYRLKQVDMDGTFSFSNITEINSSFVIKYMLEQNYPNPFNPATTIKYSIADNDFVSIKVYDILGKEVSTLVNEQQEAGEYKIIFNAASLSSGVYFYTIKAGSYTDSRKLMIMK